MKKIQSTLLLLSFSVVAIAQNFTEPLTVDTNGDAVLSFNNTDNSWQYLQFKRSGIRKTWMGLSSGNDFQIHKEGGGNILLTGGKVGIGTSSPLTNLEIKHGSVGGISIKRNTMNGNLGEGLYITGGGYSSDPDWGGISSGVYHDLGTYTSRSDAASGIEFKNGNIYFRAQNNMTPGTFQISYPIRMTIMPNGAVGIGTINPDPNFKLSVNGSIRAKEVKVEANWSDFVFHEDYELRTLEEVERHISEKGHLPEIPSEAEVTENGINLGEMNAKLLQKIEELTLYLIEQNKEIKELKEKVSSLENE